MNLGLVRGEQGKQDEAIRNFEKALSLKPRLRGANLFLGVANYKLNQFDKALVALKKETCSLSERCGCVDVARRDRTGQGSTGSAAGIAR